MKVVIAGRTRRLLDTGFEFEHARLGTASNDLVSSSGGRRAGAAHPS
jgi:hypothetical protein